MAPEKIETIYARAPLVAQAYVYGDSLKACLVGVVVPDEEMLLAWAKKKGVSGSFTDLCKLEDVKAMILSEMTQLGKDSGLHSFEQVQCRVATRLLIDMGLLLVQGLNSLCRSIDNRVDSIIYGRS